MVSGELFMDELNSGFRAAVELRSGTVSGEVRAVPVTSDQLGEGGEVGSAASEAMKCENLHFGVVAAKRRKRHKKGGSLRAA